MRAFYEFSVLLFTIPLVLGLVKWKILERPVRYGWGIVLMAWSIGVISMLTAALGIHNHFLFYAVAVLGPLPYFLFYGSVLRQKRIHRLIIFGWILVELFVVVDIWLRGILPYYSVPIMITDAILILLSILVMGTKDVRYPVRIINWTTFIYLLADFTFSLLAPTLYNYAQNQFLVLLTDGFTPFFNVIRVAGFTMAFWVARDVRPPSFENIHIFKSPQA